MKKIILILTIINTTLFAQTGINYQGAATDADGAKLVNQNISLKTSVLQGVVDGTTSYSEIHNTTTDQFGLFNVVIGQGVSISGDFETISWGSGDHFLKVELDATGGTNYNLVSTTQMMSVPYALYAKNAGLDSASVADMLASMNISSNNGGCNYSFPEGIEQMITWELFENDYVVPSGKNLYITNIYTQNASYFEIDGKRLFGSERYAAGDGAMLTLPICVKAGQTISYFHYSGWNNPLVLPSFYGTLVDAIVEPITYNFDNAGSGFENYTVPNEKKLIITQLWIYEQNDNLIIDGNIFGSHRFNTDLNGGGGNQLNIPLIINSGSILFIDDNLAGFNGYLVDEDYFSDCGGEGGNFSSTPSSIDSAMVADMIAANTSSGSGGDWELLYDELNTNLDLPWGTVNRYGIAQSDGFLYLLGSNVTVYTGNDHDTITNTWPENPLLQYVTSSDPLEPNLIPLKKNMSWHLEFHSTQGYITKGYFIPNGGGSASLANGGMSGTSKSFKYPDGMNGEYITIQLCDNQQNVTPYTVPEGKTLYVTRTSTENEITIELENGEFGKIASEYNTIENPLVIESGKTISGYNNSSNSSSINGFLVQSSSVTPISTKSEFTVPNNKMLVITNSYGGHLYVNAILIDKNSSNAKNQSNPIIANEGDIINPSGEYGIFNGYLADLDYFESPSSSSASNSGGGGNTMDLSVSQYGDTLYGLGNDFLIIPGLSGSNLHMHFNEYGSVTDIDGNTYNTLVYGDDEWMIENLRTKIGSYVEIGSYSFAGYADSVGLYYSANDLSNVCPSGWHVATMENWQNLHQNIYGNEMNTNGYTNFNSGYSDNDYRLLWSQAEGGTNQSGFNLFDTGRYEIANDGIYLDDDRAPFWINESCSNTGMKNINLFSYGNDMYSLDAGCTSTSNIKMQVRCVKD